MFLAGQELPSPSLLFLFLVLEDGKERREVGVHVGGYGDQLV